MKKIKIVSEFEKIMPRHKCCTVHDTNNSDHLVITTSDGVVNFSDFSDVESWRCTVIPEEPDTVFVRAKFSVTIDVYEDDDRYDVYSRYYDMLSDNNVDIIKPSIFVKGSDERTLAIAAFRSIASSFLARITERIGFNKNNLVIFKKGNAFVVGFNLNKQTAKAIDEVIENFVDAVYEMVKATYGYGLYQLPDINYQIPVNMAQQYASMKKKNSKNKPGIVVEKNY